MARLYCFYPTCQICEWAWVLFHYNRHHWSLIAGLFTAISPPTVVTLHFRRCTGGRKTRECHRESMSIIVIYCLSSVNPLHTIPSPESSVVMCGRSLWGHFGLGSASGQDWEDRVRVPWWKAQDQSAKFPRNCRCATFLHVFQPQCGWHPGPQNGPAREFADLYRKSPLVPELPWTVYWGAKSGPLQQLKVQCDSGQRHHPFLRAWSPDCKHLRSPLPQLATMQADSHKAPSGNAKIVRGRSGSRRNFWEEGWTSWIKSGWIPGHRLKSCSS